MGWCPSQAWGPMAVQNKASEWEPGVNKALILESSQPMKRTRAVRLDLGLLEMSEQERRKPWSEKAPVSGVCMCGRKFLGTEGT